MPGTALRAGLAAGLLLTVPRAANAAPGLHLYWPRFPRPTIVLTAREAPTREHSILLQTLSGLVARAGAEGHTAERIWYPTAHPAYQLWYADMMRQTGAREGGALPIWDLVERYRKAGIVRGYALYHYDDGPRELHHPGAMDTSVNVATSLCAPLGAVAVSEKLEPEARARGMALLVDARGLTEEECFTRYAPHFARRLLAMIDPKVGEARAEAVATGAFTLARPGPLYERVLATLEPDTPILGWGVGAEDELTLPSSRWGSFQTATNWCANLPLLSTETPGSPALPADWLRTANERELWDLRQEEGVSYASFVMSDGDNAQWLMGDFVAGQEAAWWNNPARGLVPMGWTLCYADLAQLCPYALEHLFRTETPRDDWILAGGGYFYPDLFGEARPKAGALAMHARRMADYMRMGGLRMVAFNAQRWESPAALRAYEAFARAMPDLLGILTVQYYPYTAGGGAVRWVPDGHGGETPVVSCRFGIWAGARREREGPPARVAQLLNAMPHEGPEWTANRFGWVVVHAWSYFRQAPDAAGQEVDQSDPGEGRRGLAPVALCMRDLAAHVRVVTPSEMLLQMRLRLRPRATLDRALRDLAADLRRARKARQSPATLIAASAELDRARQSLGQREYSACLERGRRCRDLLRIAEQQRIAP
ncbi:MAG: hypothetical protein IT208_05535 [Chthonomonadales bacterium]|nr:hypothetical protein [Chthonomonadales bacterium]